MSCKCALIWLLILLVGIVVIQWGRPLSSGSAGQNRTTLRLPAHEFRVKTIVFHWLQFWKYVVRPFVWMLAVHYIIWLTVQIPWSAIGIYQLQWEIILCWFLVRKFNLLCWNKLDNASSSPKDRLFGIQRVVFNVIYYFVNVRPTRSVEGSTERGCVIRWREISNGCIWGLESMIYDRGLTV